MQAARTVLALGLASILAAHVPAQADEGRAHEGMKIAVVGPSTGTMAATTQSIADGAKAAAQALSQAREALRPHPGHFEFILKDDGCEAAKAEEAAKEIVAANVDLVLGHPCPKAALAAAKIYGPAGITFIATETRHPALTDKRAGPSIFRLSGRDDAQGEDAARYLAEVHAGKPVAIVHDRTLYAKSIAEQAATALKAKKIETLPATIVAGDKEYGKLIAKIKDAGAVFFTGFPLEAGFILKELRAAGSTAPFLVTQAVPVPEFTSTFPELASGVTALRPKPDEGGTGTRAQAAVLLVATASARLVGPFQNKNAFRAALHASLAKPSAPPELATASPAFALALSTSFDTSGNAATVSNMLTRWSGEKWEPVPSLR